MVLKLFRLGTPQIILFEVGTLYLFDLIPQRNIVKIADLKAHNAIYLKNNTLKIVGRAICRWPAFMGFGLDVAITAFDNFR